MPENVSRKLVKHTKQEALLVEDHIFLSCAIQQQDPLSEDWESN